jgi:RNA polymerase sigma-70 factor (ECF subfamily)
VLAVSTTSPQPSLDPDLPLVARARGGDLEAFGQLVERHRAATYRLAANVVGVDDADDVAQEAFLRALHRIDSFRGDAPFRAWLLRIAQNAALTRASARRRQPTVADDAEVEPDGDDASARTPAQALEEQERAERLRRKLDLLTPTHRAVLVLRDIEGLSYDEIARITGAPLGSVKGRIHRARRELIELLRTNTYDWELPDER